MAENEDFEDAGANEYEFAEENKPNSFNTETAYFRKAAKTMGGLGNCRGPIAPEELTPSGLLQCVIVVNPIGNDEYQLVDAIAESLSRPLPYTSITIYVSAYLQNRNLNESMSVLKEEIKKNISKIPITLHEWSFKNPWTKETIFNTIRTSKHSTFLLLLGHGKEEKENDRTFFALNNEFKENGTKAIPIMLYGQELVDLSSGFSETKHLVVASTMCYGSKFIKREQVHPHIHYIFGGKSDSCDVTQSTGTWKHYFTILLYKEYDTTSHSYFTTIPPSFVSLFNALVYINATGLYECDIHSCNLFLVFEESTPATSTGSEAGGAAGGATRTTGGRRVRKTLKKRAGKGKKRSKKSRRVRRRV